VLKKLRASYPEYNKAITFILVDWDTYRDKPVTTDRKIPRRSTFVLIKGGKDVNRLVAATGEAQIKAMLDQALK
jgi:thioredoxin 1